MEGKAEFKLDREAMRREWQRYRRRQYQYRLAARFVIRSAIWMLSVYLVHAWDYRAVPFYLLLSIITLILILSSGGGEEGRSYDVPARRRDQRAAEAAEVESSEDGGDGAAGVNDTEHNQAAAQQDIPTEHHVRRRTTNAKSEDTRASGSSLKPIDAGRAGAGAARGADSTAEAHASVFDGVLSQSGQRTLLLAMQRLSTPGATRCAMDASFRRTLANTELDDATACVCGSGAPFGACCRPVKDELLALLKDE